MVRWSTSAIWEPRATGSRTTPRLWRRQSRGRWNRKGFLTPIADLHHGSQVAIITGEVMQVIVSEVGSQPHGRQNEDLPQGESFAALIGVGILEHVGGDQLQRSIANLWLRIEVLQAAENGDHGIAAFDVERDLCDGSRIQLQLILMGNSHARRASLRAKI